MRWLYHPLLLLIARSTDSQMAAQLEFLKAAFKLGAVSLLGLMVLRSTQNSVVNALFMEPSALPTLILEMASRLVATLAVATIVLVAADVVWSRVSWQRELRMTRQEVKDELKQADGDPIVKARLRSLARDRMRKHSRAAVIKQNDVQLFRTFI